VRSPDDGTRFTAALHGAQASDRRHQAFGSPERVFDVAGIDRARKRAQHHLALLIFDLLVLLGPDVLNGSVFRRSVKTRKRLYCGSIIGPLNLQVIVRSRLETFSELHRKSSCLQCHQARVSSEERLQHGGGAVVSLHHHASLCGVGSFDMLPGQEVGQNRCQLVPCTALAQALSPISTLIANAVLPRIQPGVLRTVSLDRIGPSADISLGACKV
jgi:hypothetical protein